MTFLRPFRAISKADTTLAGGKGASLGEMTQAGIPVPGGFVVLSTAFDRFLEETDLNVEIDAILATVNIQAVHTVDRASEQIKALILSKSMPKDLEVSIHESFQELNSTYVAVRSSATAEDSSSAAWAGQLDTFLNTTKETLLKRVQHCWASLFTPRAIFYRFEKELHKTKISVAVVVQTMIQSEISGIAFSVHPVTEDRNQLIIEAGYGLGEAIVSGQVTPDSYVVAKSPRAILDINIAEQERGLYRGVEENEWKTIPTEKQGLQKLSHAQILELSEFILRIENHYGFPCDIEWAFAEGKFYITQSRPITTLSGNATPKFFSEKPDGIVLSKVFSREKTLLYFSMWNDSDRMGWKNFLDYPVKNNLFLILPPGQKGSVWYSQQELEEINSLLKKRIAEDTKLIENLKGTLDTNWQVIFPYLSDAKKISSIDEFENYYKHLVEWWSAMNTAFGIPDMENVSQDTRDVFLSYRAESEKFTEKMNKVLVSFWNENFPELFDLTFCIAPNEIRQVVSGSKHALSNIRERADGCFMLNETIYPMKDLESILKKHDLSFESVKIEHGEEIKGTTAYPGTVQARVKKIMSFSDVKNFKSGEILVTEMTNPDYLPMMKIAAAVITDEGGTTCHAAIASRELKVPCIVGTKNATKILRDGDLVKVDADKGVITVIGPGKSDSSDSDFDIPPTNTPTNKNKELSEYSSKFKKEDYEGLGQWIGPVLEYELWLDWSNTEESKAMGIPALTSPWISINGHHFRLKKDAHAFIREKALEEFRMGTHDLVRSILKKAEDLSDMCIRASEQIHKELSFEKFLDYFDLMRRIRFPWMSSFPIDEAATEYIKEYALKNSLNADELLASLPQLPNSLTDDQKRLFAFKQQIKKHDVPFTINAIESIDAELASAIKIYQKKTEYIGTHHMWGEERTMERLLTAIEATDEGTQANHNSTYSSLPIIILMAEASKWRLECAQSSAQLAYALRPTMIAFAKTIGCTYDDLIQLTTKEIQSLLNGGTVDNNLTQKRREQFALYRKNSEIKVLIEKDLDIVSDIFGLNKAYTNVDSIQGTIGNKGKIRGIVAIVKRPQDNSKVKKGMILVAPETTPDFIPAMGNAAAFVTNFGGITSHAAIVAREMGKPCIIGTKIATQVLKDGDLVEVDANNGIIKIISQNKENSFLKEVGLDKVDDWYEQGRWVQSPLSNIFFALWNKTQVVKDIIPNVDFHSIFVIDHYAFLHIKDRERVYEFLKKGYTENTLSEVVQRTDTRATEIFTQLKKELEHDDTYIKKNIDSILGLYKEFAGVWSIVAYMGDAPPLLAKNVGYVFSEAELFARVHPHLRQTWIEKEVEDVVDIAQEFIKKYPNADSDSIAHLVQKDKKLNELVDKYIHEYIWIHINKWIGEPIDKDHAYKRIKEEIQNVNEKNHIKTNHSHIKEDTLDGILQLSISTAYWRAECAKMEMITAYRLRNILKEIGEKNELGYEQVLLLSPHELIQTVKDPEHKILNKENVLLRQKEYFCTVTKDEEVILTSADLDFASIRNLYVLKPIQNDHGGLLKGIGSSPGYANGLVRLVESPEDFKLFKEGEILVADQTTPSFVPLMRMAAAILTGKGGITSHAAIVSRELKKPCIISIKDITKILKSGDRVEVDADKGIVRILNKEDFV